MPSDNNFLVLRKFAYCENCFEMFSSYSDGKETAASSEEKEINSS